ncbi:FadR/GntR family transcriptional regulator [Amycolatopsis saalfeldensis]|uniref:GntR family transcriptional regulator, transcriptional repressor for pyruvate dehydrogenase complex n=1 Tax=Amycolatopsis saalfeldensis TaxID=394193 RepID=A0A1H8VG87_9PSEU|nr:GntR family transcriptional regulator [Amycolatopsis saalfeldensis]SEP14294.1 GntR family transcriptional regulator, transcriptional repressor for pyruvate dehydrogenase complex [Amycolatopsis saalfeldensis]
MVTPGGRSGDAGIGASFQVESFSRIADRVADQIRNYILDQGIAEGERLPSERRLAELVGSSRLTVSQALRSLAVQGLVIIRPGSGAYVLRDPSTMVDASIDLMLRLEPESLGEAAQLRFLLELTAGRQAIARGARELEPLDRALADLTGARGSASEWIAADTVFHVEIVRLAGNRFLTSVFSSIHTALVEKAYESWVSAKKSPRWLTGAAFEEQIALHEPMARALARGRRGEFDRACVAHQRALLEHLRLDLPGWDQGL